MTERLNISQMETKDLVNFSKKLRNGNVVGANRIIGSFIRQVNKDCCDEVHEDDGRWTDGQEHKEWGKHKKIIVQTSGK